MTPNITRAVAVLTVVVVILATAWALTAGAPPAEGWTRIPAVSALVLLLAAPAAWLSTVGEHALARRLAQGATCVPAIALFAWAGTAALGAASIAVAADSPFARLLGLRPPVLVVLGMAALGGALWAWNPESRRFDGAALFGTLATAVFFLVFLGHLFGAEALTGESLPLADPSTALAAALFFALSLAILAGHAGGPLMAYEGEGPGPMAKRRLLPAAVLTPVATGFLLLYAIDGQQLSATLAVALAVFVNVLVMLLLIDGAGNKVEQLAQDRQARVEARAAQARKQGLRDPMTGTLNRRGWEAEVQAAERRCKSENLDACVLVIDLDGLKQVNDAEGHKAGDAYIQRAAGALRRAARRGDALARVGGDEFAYLAVGCDEEDARAMVARFGDSLRLSKVNASVGYAMRGRRTIARAFDDADQSMYRHKRARKLRRAG